MGVRAFSEEEEASSESSLERGGEDLEELRWPFRILMWAVVSLAAQGVPCSF